MTFNMCIYTYKMSEALDFSAMQNWVCVVGDSDGSGTRHADAEALNSNETLIRLGRS